MPPPKKKKKRALVPPPLKSLKRARQITSAFHAAEHGREVGASGGGSVLPPDRAAYQGASRRATARHRTTARFVFSALTRLGLRPPSGAARPRLLEIGAVNTQLLACPWLAVRAIDIRPAARGIEARDFFDLDPPAAPPPPPGEGGRGTAGAAATDTADARFDVVVCAMVLNCVATPARRGEMLVRMRAHLAGGGVAVVALPRRCVEKGGGGGGRGGDALPDDAAAAARWAPFEAAMAAAGLAPVLVRKASPKIAFWVVGGGGARAVGGWGGGPGGREVGAGFAVAVPAVGREASAGGARRAERG